MLFIYGTESAEEVKIIVTFDGKPAASEEEAPYVITIDKEANTVALTGTEVAEEDVETEEEPEAEALSVKSTPKSTAPSVEE